MTYELLTYERIWQLQRRWQSFQMISRDGLTRAEQSALDDFTILFFQMISRYYSFKWFYEMISPMLSNLLWSGGKGRVGQSRWLIMIAIKKDDDNNNDDRNQDGDHNLYLAMAQKTMTIVIFFETSKKTMTNRWQWHRRQKPSTDVCSTVVL